MYSKEPRCLVPKMLDKGTPEVHLDMGCGNREDEKEVVSKVMVCKVGSIFSKSLRYPC